MGGMKFDISMSLLDAGERLCEGLGDAGIELTLLETIDAPRVSHLRYRVGP